MSRPTAALRGRCVRRVRHVQRAGSAPLVALALVALLAGATGGGTLAGCGDSGGDAPAPAPSPTPAVPEQLAPAQVRAVVENYVRAFNTSDVDLYVSLFAPGGTVEDPVGSPPVRGAANLASFFEGVTGSTSLNLDLRPENLRISGNHVAFPMYVRATSGGTRFELSVIDTMDLDAEARILALRAYYSASDVKPLP